MTNRDGLKALGLAIMIEAIERRWVERYPNLATVPRSPSMFRGDKQTADEYAVLDHLGLIEVPHDE